MPEDLIETKFNQLLWDMLVVDKKTEAIRSQLEIAYKQGIIDAQTYFVEEFKKIIEKTKI